MDPGQFRDRARFERRADQPADEVGNVQAEFDAGTAIERWAKFLPRAGSDAYLAARLAGQQPMGVIVRYEDQLMQIGTGDWRMTDIRTGKIYRIRAGTDMQVQGEGRRKYMTFDVDGGVTP